jgi:predicted amidohydrolase YtcJ
MEKYDCPCCSFSFGLGELHRMSRIAALDLQNSSAFRPHAVLSPADTSRREFLQTAAAVAGAVALWPGMAGAQSAETTVFKGGTVLPVDAHFSQAQAMAIRGNKVLAVGSEADVIKAAGPNAKVVDVSGKTVLPGFIEPHMHFALLGAVGHWPDLGVLHYPTMPDAMAALKKIAKATPAGQWVEARQIDPSLQVGGDPTVTVLDNISVSQPIFLLNASGHLAYCNSKLLELAGITRDTPDPPGAAYARFPDGRPNGVMQGQNAFLPIMMKNLPLMKHLQTGFVEGCIRVGGEASACGITTLCDQATGGLAGAADLDAYKQMYASGRMKTRLRASLFYAREGEWDKAGVKFGDGDAMFRLVGWKVVTDGSNQGFTGYQREPYLNSTERGLPYIKPEALTDIVLKQGRRGWQLVLHANGDAAIDSVLDSVGAAAKAGIDVKKLRIRIEHCSILHDDQIARIKEYGISPSFLINHVYYWGKAFRDDVFGPQKASLLGRCASVENAGITWTIHSDAPVTNFGTLHKIQTAVVRNLWQEPQFVLAPEERVSVEMAIRAVTSNAAWQCHSDHEIGSLEPGKLADFVILERDPRKVPAADIRGIRILQTWMDGRQVYAA